MLLVAEAVKNVFCKQFVALGLNTSIVAFQPFAAVGMVRTPFVAVPPVPTLTLNVAVPLALIVGVVPKPLATVGDIELERILV